MTILTISLCTTAPCGGHLRPTSSTHPTMQSAPHIPPPTTHRRALLSSAALVVAAHASPVPAASADALVRRGMQRFQAGDVEGSLVDFDAVYEASPSLRPYLWQRGLSLYYAGRYEQGAAQFRMDVAVNPNDTEESIWAFLCEAQIPSLGPEAARAQMLQVGRDSRRVMQTAYEAFASGSGAAVIRRAAEGHKNDGEGFYALLYAGLYSEAHGDESAAKEALLQAVSMPYAQRSQDYMVALARVHVQQRSW